MEKLKGVGAMLIDIYEKDLYDSDKVISIYREYNNIAIDEKISKKDVPALIYAALMYDKNSPIKKEPIDARKEIAIQQSGIDKEGIDALLNLSHPKIIAIVHYYLKYQCDEQWALYNVVAQNYWSNNQKILGGVDTAKDQETLNKLLKQNIDLMDTIRQLKDDIFGDNKQSLMEIVNFYAEDFVDVLYKMKSEYEISEDDDNDL